MSFMLDGKDFPLEPALGDQSGWSVTVNGFPVEDVRTLTVVNRDMGLAFLYGASPAGPYNQGRLINRGGSVIVPTVEVDGTVYFLALRQNRPLVGEEAILEFVRGQSLARIEVEDPIKTAQRELLEEVGLEVPDGALVHLGAGNPDTSLIHGSNVHAWWLRLPSDFVEFDDGDPHLRKNLVANSESRLAENILRAEFVREDEFESPSMITSWAMGLVFRQLRLKENEGFIHDAEDVITDHVPRLPRPHEHDDGR